MRAEGISKQDHAHPELARRCKTATRADASVLRLLRLALGRAWPLASRATRAAVPAGAIREERDGRFEHEHHAGKDCWRAGLYECAGPGDIRAALWTRVASAARGRASGVAGAGSAGAVEDARAARESGRRSTQVVGGQTRLSDSRRRAPTDGIFVWPGARLGTHERSNVRRAPRWPHP